MWIAEVFQSVQGEGTFLGVPSTFLRTSGCNLRCWFCDTRYSSWEPEGTEYSNEQLVDFAQSAGNEHVVITGGEPMLVPDLVPLTKQLAELGKLVTIETAGTVFQPVAAHLLSISPKLANSTPIGTNWQQRHDARRHRPEVIAQLLKHALYQLKFVIDTPQDVIDVDHYLTQFPEVQRDRIFLMAQGTDIDSLRARESWLQPLTESRGWKLTPRLHVQLFGNTRGT